uniref:Uncharacterized protein n=1 Tax=Syphacia muris TaxID=451379 RepID=A0A0N5B067_9BILA
MENEKLAKRQELYNEIAEDRFVNPGGIHSGRKKDNRNQKNLEEGKENV